MRCASLALVVVVLLVTCDGRTEPTSEPGCPAVYGALRSVDATGMTVEFHRVCVFYDEEATAAAIEDGALPPGEDLPDPLYVRDLARDEELALSTSVRVELIRLDEAGTPEAITVGLEDFAAAFRDGFSPPRWYGGEYFRIGIRDGEVVKLEQQYLP